MNKIKVFLSCTSDLMEEVNEAQSVVQFKLNESLSDFNISIEFVHYISHGYSTNDVDAQTVINKILPKYQIYLGFLWKTIGTKKIDREPGVIEEYRIAKQKWDGGENIKLMFYFKTAELSTVMPEDLKSLMKFKEEIQKTSGILYQEYETVSQFNQLITLGVRENAIELVKNIITLDGVKINFNYYVQKLECLNENMISLRNSIENKIKNSEAQLDQSRRNIAIISKEFIIGATEFAKTNKKRNFKNAAYKFNNEIKIQSKIGKEFFTNLTNCNVDFTSLLNSFIVYIDIIPELKIEQKNLISKLRITVLKLIENYGEKILLFKEFKKNLENDSLLKSNGNNIKELESIVESYKNLDVILTDILQDLFFTVKLYHNLLQKIEN